MEDRTDLRLDDEGDAEVTALLRDVYAPPAEGAYWDALETRIMSYIKAHEVASIPVNWWSDIRGSQRASRIGRSSRSCPGSHSSV
jgi:hypothetical protein